MNLWMAYDVSEYEAMPALPDESYIVIDRVRESPVLLEEFEMNRTSDDDDFYTAYINLGASEAAKLEDDTIVMLTGASDELLDALEIDAVMGREYAAWNRIRSEIDARSKSLNESLDAILATAEDGE